MPPRFAPALVMSSLLALGGCSSGAGGLQPGQVAASRAPFDTTTMSARYVDHCMKDGGTQGRCQCEVADVQQRLGDDGLARVVAGMDAGGSAGLQALQDRKPSMTACGWPNTKL